MYPLVLRILRKIGIQKYLNYTASLKKDDKTAFAIPLFGMTGFNHFFDPEENWMNLTLRGLYKLSGGEGKFIDVGVNIGQTLLKVKSIDRKWKYIGFEPNAHCVNYVNHLIELNNFKEVTVIPCALGNTVMLGELQMFNNDAADSTASVIDGFRSNVVKKVPILTIDGKEVIRILRSTTIIKVDVEGGELEVLTGLKKILLEEHPFIICEVLPVYSGNNNVRYKRQIALEELVRECNYAIFRIDASANLIPLKEIGVNTEIENSNYLFLPKSRIDAMRSVLTIHE